MTARKHERRPKLDLWEAGIDQELTNSEPTSFSMLQFAPILSL